MINNKIGIVCLLLIATAWGCHKEDYTLPVDFGLSFSIIEVPVMNGTLVVDSIRVSLKSIDIQGYRETTDDVFMSRTFDQGENFLIYADAQNETIEFDIPQGVYNPLSFSLVFQPDENENDLIEDINEWYQSLQEEDDDLDDLQEELGSIIEDYLEEVEPCILVKGKFSSTVISAQLILMVNDPLTFKFFSMYKNGEMEVILDKKTENSGDLSFDPSYWFSIITPSMMNEAYIGAIDGVNYIFLSKYVNSRIYQAVFNRMEESTSLTIGE